MGTETAAPDPALDAAAAPADAADAPDAADASDASDAPTADAPDAADAPADAPDAADASDASDAGGWVVAGGRGALVRASAAADSARVGVLPADQRVLYGHTVHLCSTVSAALPPAPGPARRRRCAP